MATMTLDKLTKTYEDGFKAVDSLSLEINDGEFVVLVGPSGCGKSTTLRMIAGLETINSGSLHIGKREVNRVHPKDRDIAMVFQNYALYPHLTVAENMGFALRMGRVPRKERTERVNKAAELLGLESILHKKPGHLSGGQRQRVALGRAIVRKPAAFLFDEPLSNLDPDRRVATRAEIRRIQRELGTTTVYVTHDHEEAMALGDKIVVLNEGLLQQAGTPEEVYEHPKNLFVGTFLGSPRMNTLPATLSLAHGKPHAMVKVSGRSVQVPIDAERLASNASDGGAVTLGIRPHAIKVMTNHEGGDTGSHIAGRITDVEHLGFATDLVVDIGGIELGVRSDGESRLRIGDAVCLALMPTHIHIFTE